MPRARFQMLDLGLLANSRVRLVRQTEISECGLACLTMIANFHGLDTNLAAMRRRFAPSQRGVKLRTLIEIANRLGLSPRAVGLSVDDLPNLHMPAVLHWNNRHFVVLERVKGERALIHNPDGRSTWMTVSEIARYFTGAALELRRTGLLEEIGGGRKLRLHHLWQRITGLKRALAQTILLSLILQVFILASPYYIQVAVDTALPALDSDLLATLAIAFGLFTLFNTAAEALRGFVLLNAGTSVGFGLSVNVARRLFRLPVAWFESRFTGDILSRFQSILPIQKMLTEGAVASIVDGGLAVTTLLVMFFYSSLLASIATTAVVLNFAARMIMLPAIREATEATIVVGGKEQTTFIESLRGMATLRIFGLEMLRHALWQNRRIDAVNSGVRMARIAVWQGAINSLIFGIETVLSVWLSIRLVMAGSGFSLGMVFAYMAYKTQFIQKSGSFMEQSILLGLIGLHLERLSDITLTPEDPSFGPNEDIDTRTNGGIEVRNLHYRYSANDPPVLAGISFFAAPGEYLAITGPSGGGKSTLVKLLLGLMEPEQGEVLIDGLPLKRFGYRAYRRQVAGILQEDSLFSGTIAENIALFDDQADMDRIVTAATVAAVHADIMEMPMQYETPVGDMGSTLSGGQKQRLLIARAVYRQPKILIMDEGTAHLDGQHEELINQAMKSLNMTKIVIAHRKETIAAADRVLLLQDGKLRRLRGPDEQLRVGGGQSDLR